MVRVLVTVEPRMYREAMALGLRRLRPEAEVMLVSEEVLEGHWRTLAWRTTFRSWRRPKAWPSHPAGQKWRCRHRVEQQSGSPHARNASLSSSRMEDG
jgi:hypothetical protein